LPKFDVAVMTTRCGTHTVRVEVASAADALRSVELECDTGQCHCPAEACTDDVQTSVFGVREVAATTAAAAHMSPVARIAAESLSGDRQLHG
jgi:hypothetical protein